MKKLLIILCILISVVSTSFAQREILVLDSGSHSANITDLLTTSDGKYLISCSKDKTIRVWDVETGQSVRKILGQIEHGGYGYIYDGTLSADDRYMILGGLFGSPFGGGYDFRFYDFQEGRCLFTYTSNKKMYKCFAFSPDVRYFAVGSTDSVNVFEAKEAAELSKTKRILKDEGHIALYHKIGDSELAVFPPLFSYKGHQDDVLGISIFRENDEYRIVSVGADKKLLLYSLDRKKILASRTFDFLKCFALSGKHTAVWGREKGEKGNSLKIYDGSLTPVSRSELDVSPTMLSFSPEAKRLLISDEYQRSVVFDVQGGIKQISDFMTDFWVSAATWIGEENVALASGNDNTIHIHQADSGEPVSHLRGESRPIWAVGIAESEIAFGHKPFGRINAKTALERVFNLENFTFRSFDARNSFKRLFTRFKDFSLVWKRETGGEEKLIVNKNGKRVRELIRDRKVGTDIWTYGFTTNGFSVSGGSSGLLDAHWVENIDDFHLIKNRYLRNKLESDGHTFSAYAWEHKAPLSCLACDDRFLLSGGIDQKMVLYDIQKMKDNVNEKFIDIVNQKKNSPIILPVAHIPVTVSLFASDSDEYLLWTPDNYYTGSKSLYGRIGWHVNQGEGREAKYYPFEQFDLKYNRPDIVLERLGFASKEVVRGYHRLYKRRLAKMGFKESDLSEDIHVPEVSVICEQAGRVTERQEVELSVAAWDSKYQLDRLNVYINNVPILGRSGMSLREKRTRIHETTISIPLAGGENKIQVSALNTVGAESLKETIYIRCRKPFAKPDLFIATLGVSRYRDKDYDLQFADKDARDLIGIYRKNKARYGHINVMELNNERATKENILKIREFFGRSKIDDQVILFISGHGLRDRDYLYFFATHDVDFDDPAERGFRFDDLDSLFDGILALNKLMLMDTCFSGEAEDEIYARAERLEAGSKGKVRGIDRSDGLKTVNRKTKRQLLLLQKDIFTNLRYGTGAVVMTSSSGMEFSYEDDEMKNGVFTYSLLSGLTDLSCDVDGDGRIRVSEAMKWIRERVIDLTGGLQTPTMRREKIEFDYAIY
jgi:WD40 repeat protein